MTIRSCVAVAIAAAVVLPGARLRSAPQQAVPADRQSFAASTTAILVDVVVRDRRGRPVIGLDAADFEIREDGVPQRLDTFSRIARGSGIGVGVAWKDGGSTTSVRPGGAGQTDPSSAPDEETTTALVFDHLSSESLRLAQRATLEYIPMSGESSARVGIFATDPGLRIVQPYTTDRSLVRRGVARVVPSGTSAEEQKADRNDELTGRRRQLQGEVQAAVTGAVGGTGAALARNAAELGRRETELRMIQTELNMIRSFDNLDRDHRGYDTATGLLAVVRSLAERPGRKTVVFFSEGLPVSPALSARLDLVIDAANRANVTAYAVDANGLRAKSNLTAATRELQNFAEERLVQTTTGSDRTEQPLTMALERVQDTLTLDSRSGLARLADQTGGFLVEQSNDLSSAFRRIDEDNQFHYLLTYSPANAVLDGRFRAIQVRVRRPGMQVFARKGYRAVGRPRAVDAGGYEIPALALLEHTPLPNAFPVHAAGFTFPELTRPGLTPILVRLSTAALHYEVDPKRETYSAQVAIVVRLRDGQGREVQKLSQQYVLSGEGKDVEAARRGEILFYREPELLPGVYTMETIAFDAGANTGSARVSTLTVPAADAAPAMSSLILVSRIEEVADGPSPGAAGSPPLYVGHNLLYPNLGEPFRKSPGSELSFYFALYGKVAGATANAQLLRNGAPLAEIPIALPAATGPRMQHVGRLPTEALPAGTYELRIRVATPGGEASRTAYFTLQD